MMDLVSSDTGGRFFRVAAIASPLMTTASRIADVEKADAFLAEEKFLDGHPPLWQRSTWGGEYVVVWNVLGADGGPLATLKCAARATNTSVAAMNLIFQSRPLWRIDVDATDECHSNPFDAGAMGLPPHVCGPHEHAWEINRPHILKQDIWDLPYRRPIAVRRLGTALAMLAPQINLTLLPEQRQFDNPTRADLFDIGGT